MMLGIEGLARCADAGIAKEAGRGLSFGHIFWKE